MKGGRPGNRPARGREDNTSRAVKAGVGRGVAAGGVGRIARPLFDRGFTGYDVA